MPARRKLLLHFPEWGPFLHVSELAQTIRGLSAYGAISGVAQSLAIQRLCGSSFKKTRLVPFI